MDVALHRCGVTLVLDRAGVTGTDGASHNGMWDLSILQVVPGLRIAAPRDGARVRELLREAVAVADAPTVVRLPKGAPPADLEAVGHAGGCDVLLRRGTQDVLVVGIGSMASVGAEVGHRLAAQGIGVTVVDPRWVRPIDPALVRLAADHRLVVTIEDNGVSGGFGDAVARALRDARVRTELVTLGLPQRFVPHGERENLLAAAGLDAAGIVRRVREALGPVAARPAQEKRRASAR